MEIHGAHYTQMYRQVSAIRIGGVTHIPYY